MFRLAFWISGTAFKFLPCIFLSILVYLLTKILKEVKENRKRLHRGTGSRVSDPGGSCTPYQTTTGRGTGSPIISNTPSSAGANDPLIKKGKYAQIIVTSSPLPLNRNNSIK